MIDIVTIYLIFSEPHNFDFNKIIKKKKYNKNKNKSINKIKDENNNKIKDNDSIEVYDENKSASLNTFQ